MGPLPHRAMITAVHCFYLQIIKTRIKNPFSLLIFMSLLRAQDCTDFCTHASAQSQCAHTLTRVKPKSLVYNSYITA